MLAYRYEGLRKPDFETDVIALLRADFEKEVGPFAAVSRLYLDCISAVSRHLRHRRGVRLPVLRQLGTQPVRQLDVPLALAHLPY